MHDIYPRIRKVISSACENVEIGFPKGSPEFPLTTITEISDNSAVVLDGEERFSQFTVQLDIWDNSHTRQRCEETACMISALMIKAGFRRLSAAGIEEDSLHRKTMTFTGVVDEKTLAVYERS